VMSIGLVKLVTQQELEFPSLKGGFEDVREVAALRTEMRLCWIARRAARRSRRSSRVRKGGGCPTGGLRSSEEFCALGTDFVLFPGLCCGAASLLGAGSRRPSDGAQGPDAASIDGREVETTRAVVRGRYRGRGLLRPRWLPLGLHLPSSRRVCMRVVVHLSPFRTFSFMFFHVLSCSFTLFFVLQNALEMAKKMPFRK